MGFTLLNCICSINCWPYTHTLGLTNSIKCLYYSIARIAAPEINQAFCMGTMLWDRISVWGFFVPTKAFIITPLCIFINAILRKFFIVLRQVPLKNRPKALLFSVLDIKFLPPI